MQFEITIDIPNGSIISENKIIDIIENLFKELIKVSREDTNDWGQYLSDNGGNSIYFDMV